MSCLGEEAIDRDKESRLWVKSGLGAGITQGAQLEHHSREASFRVFDLCALSFPTGPPTPAGLGSAVWGQRQGCRIPAWKKAEGIPAQQPPTLYSHVLAWEEAYNASLCGSWLQTHVSVWGSPGQLVVPALGSQRCQAGERGCSLPTSPGPEPGTIQEAPETAQAASGDSQDP
jgi:hypothetical protein